MTEEQKALNEIRDEISKMSPDAQAYIGGLASGIRQIIKDHGDAGFIAFALVGAEYAAAE